MCDLTLSPSSSRYTQRQLYALVADTDSYYRFIPFVESSRTIKHTGPGGKVGDVKERPWLSDSGQPGDIHKMEHLMKIGVMGFDEEWKSLVTCEKYSRVSVPPYLSIFFGHADPYVNDPGRSCTFEYLQGTKDNMDTFPSPIKRSSSFPFFTSFVSTTVRTRQYTQ